jgi:hypothetical protein
MSQPLLGANDLLPTLALELFIPSAISVLAEANFEKHQEYSAAQPDRHQDDGEDLAGQSTDQQSARDPYDSQRESRPERQDA